MQRVMWREADMYMPNVREDEAYNTKYLVGEDRDILKGFDLATDTIRSFFDNLEVYDFEVNGEDIDLGRLLDNHPEIKETFINNLAEHIEQGRNELVVSMIDNMDDGVYEKIKKQVDGEE